MIQLRVRTEFSFKNAFGRVDAVAARLAELGCEAAGIVDGGTWGHVRWAKALSKKSIKPLFGCEVTVKDPVTGLNPCAWVLAKDTKQFYQFSTAIRKPDADRLALLKTSSGLIRFAGAALSDPDSFDYIDINPNSPLQQRRSLRLHTDTGKPLVVTSDNSYPAPNDYRAFMAFSGKERVTPQHILSEAELREALSCLSDDQFAAALRNSYDVAAACAGELQIAPLINFEGDLHALVEVGRQERLSRGHIESWTPAYQQRLERELDLIAQKKYESYFLVVSDLVAWAKQHMLVGPGRGSSAGSLVCYLLKITEIDPLAHELLFERFIDVSRNDLPDIDIDFSDSKREMIFAYLAEKYGQASVARIGNINTLRARSVISTVCEKLGIPSKEKFDVLDVLIEYSSGDSRYGHSLEDTLAQTEPGKRFAAKHPEVNMMFELENHASHTGVHAAGVIVCNNPVTDYCTVGPDGVAQIDKPDSEYLGLLKIDALGLRTLGVIEDAGVITADELYDLKLDDTKVFEVFNNRHYVGIFQFEGQAQRRVSAEVEVKSFEQIDHITALSRPGPLGGGASQHYIARAAGREAVTYRHPSMAEYLSSTMGVVLYQEQVMRICFELGKFGWEVVSEIRKAMSGRKGKEYFDRRGDEFVAGAVNQGMPEAEAREVWSEICTFGAWGMNRCISAESQVKLCHPNQFLGANPTIKQVYDYYKCSPSPWIRQRKSMPILLSVGEDGVARPAAAKDIIFTGIKPCVKLTFSDGRTVTCTRDHKFIINDEWLPCGKAEIGAEFSTQSRKRQIKRHAFFEGKGWRKNQPGLGRHDNVNGKTPSKFLFKELMDGKPCERCGQHKKRMEVHHNDNQSGLLAPDDLAWLCSGCHKKRHIDAGTWLPPYTRGWSSDAPAILACVEDIGEHETYDIHMPAPNHNYVLSNGIVTHNSHTVSYAVISYWCAYLKRYHPIEYFAACLRNAKDDDQAYELLREAHNEGITYVPFDVNRSDVDWTVVDGELIGGFMNLVGYGPAKAVTAAEHRRLGKLDAAKIAKAEVKFSKLFPMQADWGHVYADPESVGCQAGSRFSKLNELPNGGEVLILGRVTKKELRDENETIRLARRDGKRVPGQTLFLDIFVTDDSGVPITVRIDRHTYEPLGKIAAEKLKVGDVIMVRGNKIPNFAMVKVKRMRCMNRPETLCA